MTANLDRILEKVRSVLAVADHPSTGAEEAATFRSKAERMMRDYKIEESQLSVEQKALAGIRPVSRTIRVCKYSSEYRSELWSLAFWAVDHVDGRVIQNAEQIDEEWWLVAKVYGFESDIRYAEMIFTAAQMAFTFRLEPTVVPSDGDQINAYRMRAAGMERNRIAHLLWSAAYDDGKAHGKVQALYKRECLVRGENATMGGRGVNAKVYRESYAKSFVGGIVDRLWRLRVEAQSDSAGTLVLASRKEQVNELYYMDYPHMRPSTEPVVYEEPKGKPKKIRPRKYKATPVNHAAAAVGREAARSVDLTNADDKKRRRMDDYNSPIQIGD